MTVVIRTLIGATAGAALFLASAMLWFTVSTPSSCRPVRASELYYGAESGRRDWRATACLALT